jgi:methylisocitrate lyase
VEKNPVTGKPTKLRTLLHKPGPIVGPCVYDCISARIAERVGFSLILHGGYNSAASMLGIPDIGLITMSEMMYAARNIACAVGIPVLMDVDDGFGDIPNVIRTTREAIDSGLAGLYIEDQVFPKRSPSIGVNECVSIEDMNLKLKAIVHVKKELDPDFVIVARTHSSRMFGMDDAVRRSIAYAEAGADLIFVDPGYSQEVVEEEFRRIVEEIVPHVPCIANMTENCGRPLYTSTELHDMGFKVIIYPLTAAMTAAAALERVFAELKERGSTKAVVDSMWPPEKFKQMIGASDWIDIKTKIGGEP